MTVAPSWERIPPEYSTALGQLALGASEIDILLTDVAGALLEVDVYRAIAVIHHQQPASKVSTIKAMCRLLFRDDDGNPIKDVERIIGIIDRAGAEAEYRNSLIHAYWILDEENLPRAVRFSARGEVKRSRRHVEVTEIQSHVGAIRGLLGELRELRDHLRYVFVKSAGATRPPPEVTRE
jgi:hypothetical protein